MQMQNTPSQKLNSICNIILDNVDTEKIYLLPTQVSQKQLPIPERLPTYHLLVLTKHNESKTDDLERKLERDCAQIAATHIILYNIHAFNNHLQTQQYFFPELSRSTAICNHNHRSLAPRPPMNTALVQRSLHQSFSLLHRKSEQLFQSAKDQWTHGVMNIEALAEAIPQLYTAIEIVFTGHHPQTRNLLRLRNSTSRFSPDIASLFPCHTAREKQLLNRLHQTSMQIPSKAKSSMSAREYEATLRRAHEVQMVALLACQHHINTLNPAVGVTNTASA